MTLSLYVLRHAKAEELVAGQTDLGRALKKRGRRAAELVGRTLTRIGEVPELVLSSNAVRARETAEHAQAAGDWKAPLELLPAIYEAGPERLKTVLNGVAAPVVRLLLVGHQPGLGLLIGELTGHEPDFPTGALARIDFELERWSELAAGEGRLAWLVTPDLLGPRED